MAEKNKSQKAGRNKKDGERYLASGHLDVNRKRKMRRHLRDNPDDAKGRQDWEKTYGSAKSLGLTARGKRKEKRATEALEKVINA